MFQLLACSDEETVISKVKFIPFKPIFGHFLANSINIQYC